MRSLETTANVTAASSRLVAHLKDKTMSPLSPDCAFVFSGCRNDWDVWNSIEANGGIEVRAEYTMTGAPEWVDLADLLTDELPKDEELPCD